MVWYNLSWAGWVMKGLIEEPINCRDVRPVSSPVTVSSHRGEFNSSRLVDKSARTRRMPCIFKLFLSLLKYVLFGRVFRSFDFTLNIQTNFKNSKRNTIVGSVICGLELGKERNMAGKRTGKNKKVDFFFFFLFIFALQTYIKCLQY